MKRKVFLLVTAVAAFAVIAGPAVAAKGGNSANAKLCQKDGWTSLSPSSDPSTGFASEEACTSYGAQNGDGALVPTVTTLHPTAEAACEDLGLNYNEPGGSYTGEAIHFTCGDGNNLTLGQAWDIAWTPVHTSCNNVANGWGTVSDGGVNNYTGQGWYYMCYGTLN